MMTKRDPAREYRARHDRGARCRCRRRRCGDGSAVQRGARTSRSLRPPHRPQYPDDPHRGGEHPSRRRSRRGLGRDRGADRCARRGGLGPVPGDRAGGRRGAARSKPGRSKQGVAKVRAAREANIARRKDSLVGTSDFPDLAEDRGRGAGAAAARGSVDRTRRRSRRSGSPNRSSACATGATSIARSTARGRKSSLPVSEALRTSMRGRVSPKACSRRAASRPSKEMAATSRNDLRNSGAKLACLCSSDKVYEREADGRRQGAEGSGRQAHLPRRQARRPVRPRSNRPALAAFFIKAVIRSQVLSAAYDEI